MALDAPWCSAKRPSSWETIPCSAWTSASARSSRLAAGRPALYDGTSAAVNLSKTPSGDSYHACIVVDDNNNPHVAWYECTDQGVNCSLHYTFKE
jgi:hypothetical protein